MNTTKPNSSERVTGRGGVYARGVGVESIERVLSRAVIDALRSELPLDATGHVSDCGYDSETHCNCISLAPRIAAVIAPLVAEAQAQAEAWDEGYVDGLNDSSLAESDDGWHSNPYDRAAALTQKDES